MSDIIYIYIDKYENSYEVRLQVDSFDACAHILYTDNHFVLLADSYVLTIDETTEKLPEFRDITQRRHILDVRRKLRKIPGKPILVIKHNIIFSHIQEALEFICGLKLLDPPSDSDFIDNKYKFFEIRLQNKEHNAGFGRVKLRGDIIPDELKPIIDNLEENLRESVNKYATLASVIRFIQTHQKWINNEDKCDSNYVYLPYPYIIKEYLSCLSDIITGIPNIKLTETKDTSIQLLYDALSCKLETIYSYYQELERTTSFIDDLNGMNTPSGLNDTIIDLLKDTNNLLVNGLKEFKLSTGESLFLVSDFLKNYGYAVSIIPERYDGPDYRIGILKEYFVVLRNYLNCPDIDSDCLYDGWKFCLLLLNPNISPDKILNIIQKHTMWGLYSDKHTETELNELLELNNNTIINIKDKNISEEIRSGKWAEGTVENAKFLIKLLRHHFLILGIDNKAAKVLSVLLVLGPQTLSTIGQLTSATSNNLRILKDALSGIMMEWDVSKWEYKIRNGKIITKYYLNSPTTIINKVKEMSSNTLKEMREALEEIEHIIEYEDKNTKPSNGMRTEFNQDKLLKLIVKLGLTEQAAQYLVRLYYNPGIRYDRYATMDGISSFCASDVTYLRKMINSGWIHTKDSGATKGRGEYTQYYLTEPLYDILLDYTYSYVDGIDLILNDLDVISEFLLANNDIYSRAFNSKTTTGIVKTPLFDEIISQHLLPYIEEMKRAEDSSLELSLMKPISSQIRVYLYPLNKCDANDLKHNNQYSIEISIHGDRVNTLRSFNSDNVDLVLLGGYVADFDMYVFWNPYSFKEFTNNRQLYVDEEDIYSALVEGTLVKDVKYKSGRITVSDKIYITTSDNLVGTIDKLKDKYLDDLLNGD